MRYFVKVKQCRNYIWGT